MPLPSTMLAGALLSWAGPTDPASVPGGVAGEDAVYLAVVAGIEAIDLRTGQSRWTRPDEERPVLLVGDTLLLRREGIVPLELTCRRRADGALIQTLPPLALPMPHVEVGAIGVSADGALWLQWSGQTVAAGPAPARYAQGRATLGAKGWTLGPVPAAPTQIAPLVEAGERPFALAFGATAPWTHADTAAQLVFDGQPQLRLRRRRSGVALPPVELGAIGPEATRAHVTLDGGHAAVARCPGECRWWLAEVQSGRVWAQGTTAAALDGPAAVRAGVILWPTAGPEPIVHAFGQDAQPRWQRQLRPPPAVPISLQP